MHLKIVLPKRKGECVEPGTLSERSCQLILLVNPTLYLEMLSPGRRVHYHNRARDYALGPE